MDRHVIKGRGPNRGNYLCYSRMAGLPPGGDHVWLPEQSKAMRCKDFEAGRVVGRACLKSEDAPGRDGNPFELDGQDAPRARAWDDGFLLGLHEASCGKGEGASAA